MHNHIQNTTYTFITHTHTYIHYIYTTYTIPGDSLNIYLVTSILPKIGEFATARILPKRLVEYVFLCHEMAVVCPEIAEDIEELF